VRRTLCAVNPAQPASQAPPAGALPSALRLGPVHLTVADLDRAIAWYERALGMRLHRRDGAEAELGDALEAVVVLREDREAKAAGRHAGLYHYALLYPRREELARAALRLIEAGAPIQGMSDHGTHEAIYLPDADGNGIELAADRTMEVWPSFEEEFARGGPAPLDLDDLLRAAGEDRVPADVGEGLRVGHLHLHVGDIDQGIAFYCDVIGFELKANIGTAAFVAAGGYHHHLAFNVWKGRGVGPAPPHTAGLRHWTVELSSAADVDAVRGRVEAAGAPVDEVTGGFRAYDPWGIAADFVASA
jgi:catechol 2,3-dioxygenase